jgi:hypothetical protein
VPVHERDPEAPTMVVPSESLLASHKAECERLSAEKVQLLLAVSRSGCGRAFCAVAQGVAHWQEFDGIPEGGEEEEDATGVWISPLSELDRLAPRVGAHERSPLAVDDE